MSNISATLVSCGMHACEVILTYLVYTYYPSGAMTVHYDEMEVPVTITPASGPRITVPGLNHACHFLVANSILYIETGSRSPYAVFVQSIRRF